MSLRATFHLDWWVQWRNTDSKGLQNCRPTHLFFLFTSTPLSNKARAPSGHSTPSPNHTAGTAPRGHMSPRPSAFHPEEFPAMGGSCKASKGT
uniref:Uncharacterized protein n=1 Tax=Chromera velia CCMP2878 TaxID=1169474 RepID=A0A0G4HUI9_9ALVE|eukprot:Cvel_8661.t1-p1 / transcript=Cvel_8661.t1 / gene=Cvel_8661 / organism=Chromera_velia_CCMP2878 / gene_product=hypothetical protein / transcript_product=hypothetical protein / location=Cvel_scaffold483:30248-30523(+) / protein_length=92 / sequence_SO=supercontig / SO=protein_coding / is_pseudo=false